jgi:hypothetical protein
VLDGERPHSASASRSSPWSHRGPHQPRPRHRSARASAVGSPGEPGCLAEVPGRPRGRTARSGAAPPGYNAQPEGAVLVELGAGNCSAWNALLHGRRSPTTRWSTSRSPASTSCTQSARCARAPAARSTSSATPRAGWCRGGHCASGPTPGRWSTTSWGCRRATTGTVDANAVCLPGCAPAFWQQRRGSGFLGALNSVQETFPGSTTASSTPASTRS